MHKHSAKAANYRPGRTIPVRALLLMIKDLLPSRHPILRIHPVSKVKFHPQHGVSPKAGRWHRLCYLLWLANIGPEGLNDSQQPPRVRAGILVFSNTN